MYPLLFLTKNIIEHDFEVKHWFGPGVAMEDNDEKSQANILSRIRAYDPIK